MSNTIAIFWIAASLLQVSEDYRHVDAIDVFRCGFEAENDINYDLWPDDWTRQRDTEHPAYLPISISDADAVTGNRCLRIQLDGGAAAVYSPVIEVTPQFSYVLGGYRKTAGLVNDVAYCSVSFYDADNNLLETHRTQDATNTDWQPIQMEPLTPVHEGVRKAVIGLHLEPRPNRRADLEGSAWFDDIWLGRLPRMSLSLNHRQHVYQRGQDVVISCDISGVLDRNPLIEFELWDAEGNRLAATKRTLNGQNVGRQGSSRGHDTGASTLANGSFAGTATWRPPISDYGFYRIRVAMPGRRGLIHQRDVTMVVIRPLELATTSGEFGWTLPDGDSLMSMEELIELMNKMGLSWLKFPVWYSELDTARPDQIAWFAERLQSIDIEMVGMLDQPPQDIRDSFGESDRLQVAQLFSDTALWKKHLNPVLTRLSLTVRWWQLGRDDDISFVGYPELVNKIDEVRQHLERFGQQTQLGFVWRWMYEPPTSPDPPWKFLTYTTTPPLTPQELDDYLSGNDERGTKRWVVIEPLERGRYHVDARSRDLVHRMLTAKLKKANAIFIPDPFDRDHGLMNQDGSPGELLLPWRTTALLLSGCDYLGSLELPNGSQNHVFQRGQQAIMIAWNNEATEETMFFGRDVEVIDLWGRSSRPRNDGHRQVISVGPQPVFVTGINLSIALWRLRFSFSRAHLSSIFGRPQRASYQVVNTYSQGISGVMNLDSPDEWGTDLRGVRFKLAEGDSLNNAFDITLRPVARSGEHKVRVDFEVAADRTYRFSLYRRFELGLGDVSIKVSTSIDEAGSLVVSQQLANRTDSLVNFDCMLFAPNRRRQRRYVLNLGRGRNNLTYILPNGEELIGKTIWLRAEEIGGDRMLNHEILVEK